MHWLEAQSAGALSKKGMSKHWLFEHPVSKAILTQKSCSHSKVTCEASLCEFRPIAVRGRGESPPAIAGGWAMALVEGHQRGAYSRALAHGPSTPPPVGHHRPPT